MNMHTRAWGADPRPAIVLLHALGCHGGWWEWTAPHLAEHFRVIAPDFRGHGDSPCATDYTFEAYAHDVGELIASLQGRPYALVGHSMGGYVSLVTAASGLAHPPAAVAVVDMKTEASEQELADLKAAAGRPARSYASLAEAVARYRLSPPEHAVPAERLQAVATQSFRMQNDSTWTDKFDRRALAIDALDPDALVKRLPCPVLFVRGERSVVMPHDSAAQLADLAGAHLVVGKGLFHHLPLENPQWLAQTVLDFLREKAGPFRYS